MSLVVGIDVETTGLDHKEDHIIEIGAVLWHWDDRKPLMMFSEIIKPDKFQTKQLDPLITKITGITETMINFYGRKIESVLPELRRLCEHGTHFMAHNAPFDFGFLREIDPIFESKSWIDTLTDIPFDEDIHKSKKLEHLGPSHGFLNPFSHRAIFDVLSMCKVASEYDFFEVVERSQMKTIRLVADVTFHQKELAKEEGFRWDGIEKIWYKDFKEVDYEMVKDKKWKFDVLLEVL